ncbi:hypothetical protein H5P36_05240 [Bacillus sp. APMAM]|nr:hypothetical protein [Bacillus sp. APMAM]RTZ57425.1 hypothetical protein EKO25_02445 [Bacillus sp. SAJ1]
MEVNITNRPKFDFLKIWEIQRKFLSESVIFSLLQYPVHLSNKNESISWTLFGILFLVSFFSLLLARGQQERFITSFCWCGIPILILSLILLHIPLPEILLLFLFSLWRLSVFIREGYDDDYEEFIEHRLLATTVIFFAMYFICFTIQIQSRNSMVFFLFVQLFIYSYGTFIKRYLQNKNELTKKSEIFNKNPIFRFGVLLLSIQLGISVIVTFIVVMIKQGLSPVLNKVFWYFAYILSPIINGLITFFGLGNAKLEKRMEEQAEKRAPMDETGSYMDLLNQDSKGQEYTLIFSLVVILILAVWAYWRFKKTHFSKENKMPHFIYDKFTQLKFIEGRRKERKSTNYYSKNRQQIRKYVFDLEHYAEKMKSERLGFESVRDWLTRLDIKVSNQWVLIYEDVRYGNREVTEQELKQFVDEMERIKREIYNKKR